MILSLFTKSESLDECTVALDVALAKVLQQLTTTTYHHGQAACSSVVLVILLLPFARQMFQMILPDITGEINTQSRILEQKLESSQRLEVTTVEEEGVLEAKTNVIIFGTVGTTTIRYRYTASLGIDLSEVVLTPDSDRIIFSLPDPVILNDGIEALEVNKKDFFSHAIDKSTETLLDEQKQKCRDQYLTGPEYQEKIWADTQKAFEETLCKWLDPYGERHYSFEFHSIEEQAADQNK